MFWHWWVFMGLSSELKCFTGGGCLAYQSWIISVVSQPFFCSSTNGLTNQLLRSNSQPKRSEFIVHGYFVTVSGCRISDHSMVHWSLKLVVYCSNRQLHGFEFHLPKTNHNSSAEKKGIGLRRTTLICWHSLCCTDFLTPSPWRPPHLYEVHTVAHLVKIMTLHENAPVKKPVSRRRSDGRI